MGIPCMSELPRTILQFYVSFFRRHPLTSAVAFFVSVLLYGYLIYLIEPDLIGRIWPYSALFAKKPEILVHMAAPEKYILGTQQLLLTRVNVVSAGADLSGMGIDLTVPKTVDDVKIATAGRYKCWTVMFPPKDQDLIKKFHISCNDVGEGAEIGLILQSTQPPTAYDKYQVEIIAKYGKDRIVGQSASGSLSPGTE